MRCRRSGSVNTDCALLNYWNNPGIYFMKTQSQNSLNRSTQDGPGGNDRPDRPSPGPRPDPAPDKPVEDPPRPIDPDKPREDPPPFDPEKPVDPRPIDPDPSPGDPIVDPADEPLL